MKKTIVFAFALFSFGVLSAQETTEPGKIEGRTSFFVELGGAGILFSSNIDHRFRKSRLGPGGRVGVGFVTSSEEVGTPGTYMYRNVSVVTIPVQLNYIFGKNVSPHTFEVGAGLTYIGRDLDIFDYYDENTTRVFGSFSFMYRRQPVDGGFTWRIGFTPLVGNGYIQPFAGVGVGYNF